MKWTTDEPETDRSLYHQLLADSDNRQWPKLVERLSHPTLVLPEATYIAFFDGSPFFPSPFGQHRTHGSREAIVIGQLAEDAK